MILVTGGSGLVGKHLKDVLPEAVYISSRDYNLMDLKRVDDMMSFFKPKIVIHLAARVGNLFDNMAHPVDYLEQNITMSSNVLRKCHEYNVDRVISMLSTCIYPDVVKTYPMTEKDLFNGPPPPTNFSYGIAKRCMATHIDSYVKQYKKKWSYLIPCNLYGEYDKYGEHHSHFVSALIKKIYESDKVLNIWGSGTPLRQYMYGEDLARIIKYIIDNDINENLNVAPKEVYTIKQMAEIGKKACGKDFLKLEFDKNKPDGQFRKDVDSSKLLSYLKDFKFTPLDIGIRKVYDNFSKRYHR
tara:strand:+ start:20072 stop:20968 length:897 start_codon:yes stop_codon:yes gene_type:complete